MARTRSQTGVIEEKKYDYKTMTLVGAKGPTSTGSRKAKKKGGRTTWIGKGKTRGEKGKEGKSSSGTSKQQPALALSDVEHEPTPQPEPGRPDDKESNHWWPSVVLGEKEKEGLR